MRRTEVSDEEGIDVLTSYERRVLLRCILGLRIVTTLAFVIIIGAAAWTKYVAVATDPFAPAVAVPTACACVCNEKSAADGGAP